MKKRMLVIAAAICLLLSIRVQAAVPEEVIPVGKAVGIDVKCSGLLVVGFAEDSPARESGLHRGDLIMKIDGESVEKASQLREMLQEKAQVTLTALRQDKEQSFLVRPAVEDGLSRIGANVKSEMAGIGTVTYFDPATEVFGALGHGIADSATAKLFPVREGFICKATILSVEKGTAGNPGMLQGSFDSSEILGQVTQNTVKGIFGIMTAAPEGRLMPVATREQVKTGAAEVLCNVEGEQVERYTVNIAKLYPIDDGTGRSMMIEVTDQRLLKQTGGIVQGM